MCCTMETSYYVARLDLARSTCTGSWYMYGACVQKCT